MGREEERKKRKKEEKKRREERGLGEKEKRERKRKIFECSGFSEVETRLYSVRVFRKNTRSYRFTLYEIYGYHTSSADTCFKIDAIDQFVDEKFQECRLEDSLEGCITQSKDITVENNEFKEQVMYLEANFPYPY